MILLPTNYLLHFDTDTKKKDINRDNMKTTSIIHKHIGKRLRNLLRSSYNHRLLRNIHRKLYYKTIKQQGRYYAENVEDLFLNYIKNNIQKVEKRERNKRLRTGNFISVVPMAFRVFSFTKVFITHGVNNTFVTVFKGPKDDRLNQFKLSVKGKFSCGLLGYKGPKKSTVFARKEVIKESGTFLAGLLTTLMTVVFTSKVGRWNRKTVRNLSPNLSYVLNIFLKRTRSHGNSKQKNRRRT